MRLLGPLHQHPHTRIQSCTVAAHARSPAPAPDSAPDQTFDTAGVLVRSNSADHRQGEVAAVGFDPHRPGGEAHPVGVTALALEARETRPACRPGYQHREVCQFQYASTAPANAVGIGLFRALRPPHRTGLGVHAHVVS